MADYVQLGTDPYGAHRLVIGYCSGARRVLDVGCSAGAIGVELLRRGAAEIDGIDVDEEAAAEARRSYGTVLVGDIETMEWDLQPGYDAIVCADVIEHLRDPRALLRRLRPLLASGGRLVVSTPNIGNWSMRLLHLLGRWEYTERGIMDRTHLRFFTKRTLLELVRGAGYEVEAVDVTVPLPVLRRQPFNQLAHSLGLRWKSLLAYQLIVVAEARG